MNNINNYFRTAILLLLLSLFMIYVGDRLAGVTGATFLFLLGATLNILAFYKSDELAVKMVKATPLPRQKYKQVYKDTKELAEKMGIPMPRLYIYKEKKPNAFATGRSPKFGVVVLTSGLVKHLSTEEIKGVVAHELSHIKNRDVLTSTIAALLVLSVTIVTRLTLFFGLFGLIGHAVEQVFRSIMLLLLAPVIAAIIQMAISRSREYAADATAAVNMGTGEPLMSALSKLEGVMKEIEKEEKKQKEKDENRRTVQKHIDTSLNHMYTMSVVDDGFWATVFSSHPSTADRIERLKELTAELNK